MPDSIHDGAAILVVYAVRRSAQNPDLPSIPGNPDFIRWWGTGWSTIYPTGRAHSSSDLRLHVYHVMEGADTGLPGGAARGVYIVATEGDPGSGPRGATRVTGTWVPTWVAAWTLPELLADEGTEATAIKAAWPPRYDGEGDPIVEPPGIWWSIAGADHHGQADDYATVAAIPAGAD